MEECFALRSEEIMQFGCPYCGSMIGGVIFSKNGSHLCMCTACNRTFIALEEGLTQSAIQVTQNNNSIYPTLSKHPNSP